MLKKELILETYKTVYCGREAEIVEKKSRFIANLAHVETEEEALAFVDSIRRKYWDARHNCYAYSIGKKPQILRCSDDGEPSQTAGKPMMDVLAGEALCDSIIVVTRYFGGTLLGTGGLVRAYSQAAKKGIEESTVITKIPAKRFEMRVEYNQVGKLLYIIGQEGLNQLESDYGEKVSISFLVPNDESVRLEKKLEEAFNASVRPIVEDFGYYAQSAKGLLLFEHK